MKSKKKTGAPRASFGVYAAVATLRAIEHLDPHLWRHKQNNNSTSAVKAYHRGLNRETGLQNVEQDLASKISAK